MAAVQILKVAHHIKGGVEAVGDNVNQLIEGTFSTLTSTRTYNLKPKKRLDGKEAKARKDKEQRGWFFSPAYLRC